MSTEFVNDLVYGKIIIDDVRLVDGSIVENVIGGGGPQAVFAASLWSDSVGFLSRSGADIGSEHVATLEALQVDLSGWMKYPDLPTPRTKMQYDENEYGIGIEFLTNLDEFNQLLNRAIDLPAHFQRPRVIHLITEFPEEPMVQTALKLREQGTIFSLEPLMDFRNWKNQDGMLALFRNVDLVTPDWPSASGLAGSEDPKEVMEYWSTLGPDMIAIRHGHHGSYTWDSTHRQTWHIAPVAVEVVDPTGGGNSYGGGLCVGWAESKDARIAGCYGTVAASFLVRRYGLPKMSASLREEARSLLKESLQEAAPL